MEAVDEAGVADIAAIADPNDELVTEVASTLRAETHRSFENLLESDVDGVVIATPSALHAEQCIAALERGLPVFCQKPLARTTSETRRVLDAARANDVLLGVDLSYRFTTALGEVRKAVAGGVIGDVFAADLTFHNAYGPDKPWFLDPQLAGGGCAIDLGTHLIDAALWVLGWPAVDRVDAALFKQGRRMMAPDAVEDYATASLDLDGGARVKLDCSWFLHAGQDAQIELSFYGDKGSVSMRNVDGSFYDFVAERREGRNVVTLASPPDAWGGRAIVEWATRLTADRSFDPTVERVAAVAEVLDRIYGRAS